MREEVISEMVWLFSLVLKSILFGTMKNPCKNSLEMYS